MPRARCVYCLATKELSEFNREHVLPEAFGKYEENLVLIERVCVSCNDYFSKHLDAPLARDSKEGIERFQHGLVREKKRRRLGRRITLKQRGGRLDGSLLDMDLDPPGIALAPKPSRQVGFGTSEEGPFEWFRLEELPDLAALRAKGFTYAVTGGLAADEATAIFATLGLTTTDRAELPDPRDSDGMLDTTMEGRIDTTIRRAIAKVAFNYFTYFYPGLAQMDQFRAVRDYVRFDAPTDQDPVKILSKPILGNTPADKQILVHVITVRWNRVLRRVVAQVSLFGWLQYEVTLSRDRFVFPPSFVDSGHAFNPFAAQIAPLTRDRRRAAAMHLVEKESAQFQQSHGTLPCVGGKRERSSQAQTNQDTARSALLEAVFADRQFVVGTHRLVWPKQFTLLNGARLSVLKVARAVAAAEALSSLVGRTLRRKKLDALLANASAPVMLTRGLARSLLRLYADDLYGVTAELEAIGLGSVSSNRLDIEDVAIALIVAALETDKGTARQSRRVNATRAGTAARKKRSRHRGNPRVT